MTKLIVDSGPRARSGSAHVSHALTMLLRLTGCLALALVAACSHSDAPFIGSSGSTRPTATPSPMPCEAGPRWELFLVLDTMPKPIVNAFLSRLAAQTDDGFKPIVDRDQFFNATDKTSSPQVSLRRFIQGGHLGNAWVILYEQGGQTPRVHAVVYEWSDRNASPLLNAHVDTTVKAMCDTARDLVSHPTDPHPILEDW